MKKILLICFFICTVLVANAQNFYAGGKFGYGTAIMLNKNTQQYGLSQLKSNIYSVGASFKYYPDNRTYYDYSINGLSAELRYEIESFKYKYLNSEVDRKVNRISVPVMLQSTNQDWGLYGEIGLKYTYTLNESISGYLPIKFNRNSFGTILGFGFDSRLSRSISLTTGIRGYYNIIDDTKNIYSIAMYKQYHALQATGILGLSYYFDSYHDNH